MWCQRHGGPELSGPEGEGAAPGFGTRGSGLPEELDGIPGRAAVLGPPERGGGAGEKVAGP